MDKELKEQLKQRLAEQHALKVFYESTAGGVLKRELVDAIASCVYTLRGMYKTASHQEIVAQIAKIDAILMVLDTLKTAKSDEESLTEELDENTDE